MAEGIAIVAGIVLFVTHEVGTWKVGIVIGEFVSLKLKCGVDFAMVDIFRFVLIVCIVFLILFFSYF